MDEPDKVAVSFYVNFKKVPEENVQNLKLEIDEVFSELAKKYSPEDILVTLIWY